jgi:hypothetical protein
MVRIHDSISSTHRELEHRVCEFSGHRVVERVLLYHQQRRRIDVQGAPIIVRLQIGRTGMAQVSPSVLAAETQMLPNVIDLDRPLGEPPSQDAQAELR